MIAFYTNSITPRLKYIVNFIIGTILGSDYFITDDEEEYKRHSGPKINYSPRKLNDGISINPHNLLFEDHIEKKEIFVTQWDNVKIFFQTDDHSTIPFDLFAAAFYLISRYEEHLPFKKDRHDRFEARISLAHNNNFLQIPVVDKWAYALSEYLSKKYPGYQPKERKFTYLPSIDIDNAYAFLFKGISKTLGSTLRSLINLDIEDNIRRYRTLAGKKDPYDTYNIFFDIHHKYNIKPTWFFLVGNSAKFDTNISLNKQAYRELIQSMSKNCDIGVHFSYNTRKNYKLLKQEVADLEGIINKKVIKSRQHYLRLHFTETYRNLIKAGIEEDYTMGYATEIGFRAGTCTPFKYFDLFNNEETPLKIYPFQIMDITLNKHKGYNVTEAISAIESLVENIKEVNGTFISIWHNEALSDHAHWKDWETVYREMLRFVFE